MARPADLDDLEAIMKWHPDRFGAAVHRQLGFTPLQPSIPMDGKGLRVKVMGAPNGIPNHQPVEFVLAEERLAITVEIA